MLIQHVVHKLKLSPAHQTVKCKLDGEAWLETVWQNRRIAVHLIAVPKTSSKTRDSFLDAFDGHCCSVDCGDVWAGMLEKKKKMKEMALSIPMS